MCFVCVCVLFRAGGLPDEIIAVIAVIVAVIIIIKVVLGIVALVGWSYRNREQKKLEYRSASLSFRQLLSMVCSAVDLLDVLQPSYSKL